MSGVAAAVFATVAVLAGYGLTTAEGHHAHPWIYFVLWPLAWAVFWWEIRDLRRGRP